MKLKDAIVPACALVITVAVLWRIAKGGPVFPGDEGKEERDSTEQASKVDLNKSVREKQWADSVLQRAADIANSRDRERIVTNTESYARSNGLDTMSYILTRRH